MNTGRGSRTKGGVRTGEWERNSDWGAQGEPPEGRWKESGSQVRQDSGRWTYGEAHLQCRVGSLKSDTAVPRIMSFQEGKKVSKTKCSQSQKTSNK